MIDLLIENYEQSSNKSICEYVMDSGFKTVLERPKSSSIANLNKIIYISLFESKFDNKFVGAVFSTTVILIILSYRF